MNVRNFLNKHMNHFLFWSGIVFSLTQLIVPMFFQNLLDIQVRALHVTLGVSIALLCFPFRQREGQEHERSFIWDVFLIAVIVLACFNVVVKALDIYMKPGGATSLDLLLGTALLIIVLEAARRTVGAAIPILVAMLFVYIYVAPYLGGLWKIRGLSFNFIMNSVYYSPLGLFGSVTGMSATFIAMFIIFGSLLSATGGGKTFIDLALALTGRFVGGPAKAAVISSALFGSISGSSVANVMVTGSYTIPLMKRLGYKPEFAGAVEAIASTGGGITPPIMSITAFMMAEFLNISYMNIIGYALLPCILFYTGVFSGVHFQTKRRGLSAVPEDEIPKWKDILTFERMAGLVIPTVVLLYLIGTGQPLLKAGFYASVSSIVVLVLSDLLKKKIKETPRKVLDALSEAGADVARIAPILISVSVLVNLIGITGIAPKISGLILKYGGSNIFIALLVATIVPFLLGTSLPVVPTYVLSVSILVPPLMKIGIDQVAAHLFFIYWAILGGVTPPTCTAAVAAASISKGNWVKTGLNAVKLGAVAFILPYFFALNPSLVGRGSAGAILSHGLTGFVGAIAIAYGFFGFGKGVMAILSRVLFFVSGILLLFPDVKLSAAGMVGVVIAFVWNKYILKQERSSLNGGVRVEKNNEA
ncbi:MAG: TRAP transporter fused permease subunit [Aminobacterium colombiense]|uniref:TRAP transporter, 4TM/12TM fusion protein n=2 Tax=Aminobacteriaceae TaxID=3029087 RepID=D5EGY5_AMICL|nr:TRAP transporter, 4TM/12TM fusion protein [Aminobacterium colombiense DSM 12261]MDD4265456.1 TRAP transporter fused permease subunit [Aminobacterium colombiense]